MAEKSELELFLQSRAAEGQLDSRDAAFTLAAQEALQKLASYQLPFEGAWAVKIIQSIVAGGSGSPIRVDLLATAIRFYFLDPGFTLKELETAFHEPHPSPNRSLRYLLSGLWSIGLKDRWGFQVAFPRESRTLIWDGCRLHEYESQQTRDCVCIDITPSKQKSSLSWVSDVVTSGYRNVALLTAIAQNCYLCPLPLTVDGLRLDSLQRSEHQGWSETSRPLLIGLAEAELPRWPVPPGTFEPLRKSLDSITEARLDQTRRADPPSLFHQGLVATLPRGGGGKPNAATKVEGLAPCDRAAVAYVLCVHGFGLVTSGGPESLGPSVVYWVLDGALVGTESLESGNHHCSIGCFLSAEGLETDISSFGLMESPERRRRVQLAWRTLTESLAALNDASFEEKKSLPVTFIQRALGGAAMTAGVVLLFSVSPALGVVATLFGASIFATAGSQEYEQVALTQAAARELGQRLASNDTWT